MVNLSQGASSTNLSRDEQALGFQFLVLLRLVHSLLLKACHLLRGESARKLPLKECLQQHLFVGCALAVVRLEKNRGFIQTRRRTGEERWGEGRNCVLASFPRGLSMFLTRNSCWVTRLK